MHLIYKETPNKLPRKSHKHYNKHNPDVTISKNGLEYDMSKALVHAYYASERLAESHGKHESLNQYDNELNKNIDNIPHRERNPKLEHARSIKVDRHRQMLPSFLF